MKTVGRYGALAALVLATPLAAAEIQAPVVTGAAGAAGMATPRKPEIYKDGWIDLDKNGVKDIYEDSTQSVEKRVEDLLGRMNRAERIGQLWQLLIPGDPAKDNGLPGQGAIGSYLGYTSKLEVRNALQRAAVEDSRLGVPLIFGFDVIHGMATVCPIPVAQSCSWDPELVARTSAMAAAEASGMGIDWTFAPMVDIARDPRWGRIAEGFGEDPWLDGQFAAAAVRGFQGADPRAPEHMAACLKHYVGYGAAEGGRDYNTTEISPFTLRNIYLPPFHAGVDAGALTLMSAFNCLNGIPASGNHFICTQVLRDEWKFSGFIVSDWNAVAELIRHGYAADDADAAAKALTAGVDMEMVSGTYHDHLAALLDSGRVKPEVLDEAVRRVLRVKFERGLFDRPYTVAPAADPAAQAVRTALAREAAAHSCVLLKNEHGILPLRTDGGRIALLGPLAANGDEMLGSWSAIGRAADVVPLNDGLAAALHGANLVVAEGCKLTGQDTGGFAAALAAARQADVVIMALGEPRGWSGENSSRSELGLTGVQQQLFDQVAALGKPVIVVLFAGRPLAIPALQEKAAAIVMAWQPGVQAGPGLADVLTGATEPTGRLTTSFPHSVGAVPAYYNYLPTGRPRDQYKDGTRAPLYPFGYGLTYTQFAYSAAPVATADVAPTGTLHATATITNTGPRRGSTVAQFYIHALASTAGCRPVRELKGFQRVTLDPGQSKEVTFTLPAKDLGCFTSEGQWVVEPGRYEVFIAADSASGSPSALRLTEK